MSLVVILLSGGGPPPVVIPRGVYLPAHDTTLILEVSDSPALAADQNWLDASAFLVNLAGQLQGEVEWSHGRDSETDRFREGALSVLLDNTQGMFDRRNTESPFVGALRSLRQIRLRAHRGVPGAVDDPETQFRGFVRGWPRSYGMVHQFSWITLKAFTGFRVLAGGGLEDGTFTLDHDTLGLLDVGRLAGDTESEELTGARIEAIADVAGWPADLRAIDEGLVYVGDSDADSPLEGMWQAEEAEGGYLFIAKDGTLTFLDRFTPWENPRQTTSQATFGGALGLKLFDVDGIGPDADRIRNEVIRSGLSGIELSSIDEESIAEYGRQTDGPDSTIAVRNSDVEGLTAILLHRQVDDDERLEELVIEATVDPNTLYDELIERQILDRITVELTEPWGETSSDDWLVQNIHQSVTRASWRGVYRLAPTHDLDLFTLAADDDVEPLAALDGDGVLAP